MDDPKAAAHTCGVRREASAILLLGACVGVGAGAGACGSKRSSGSPIADNPDSSAPGPRDASVDSTTPPPLDASTTPDALPAYAIVPYDGAAPSGPPRVPVQASLLSRRVYVAPLMFAAGEMQTSGEPFASLFA